MRFWSISDWLIQLIGDSNLPQHHTTWVDSDTHIHTHKSEVSHSYMSTHKSTLCIHILITSILVQMISSIHLYIYMLYVSLYIYIYICIHLTKVICRMEGMTMLSLLNIVLIIYSRSCRSYVSHCCSSMAVCWLRSFIETLIQLIANLYLTIL